MDATFGNWHESSSRFSGLLIHKTSGRYKDPSSDLEHISDQTHLENLSKNDSLPSLSMVLERNHFGRVHSIDNGSRSRELFPTISSNHRTIRQWK